MEVKVMAQILDKNDKLAREINQQLTARGIYALNLLGSPGAGKTALLEATISRLKNEVKLAVIEGDLYTDKDKDRIARHGVPVFQINTAGGCHLDATMVEQALASLDLSGIELLIIENVGNLVCPANFNVGEHAKVVVLSVTEGEDKPLKYPLVFQESSAVVLNKIDLLPYTNFNLDTATADIKTINSGIQLFNISCRSGEGLHEWCCWLKGMASTVSRQAKV
ncbi:Hydrogenase maturation factor HypB [Sporomusa carbonis]|uniref:hydrogenase nickel incorporation protein HypB n=1 Tax=Sporomusa carbonis TaxID=3076075 RepID=UPI003A6579AC